MLSLSSQIEGLLFYLTKPTNITELVDILESDPAEINQALEYLTKSLEGRGIVLINHNNQVSLGTSKEIAPIIESLTTKDRGTPLSQSAIETLAIILYQGPIAKPVIDYIRGVNSQFMIRALLLRGLIEKTPSPKNDSRTSYYQLTTEALQSFSLETLSAAPNYEDIRATLSERLAVTSPNE